jgi:hypothetical protein
MKNLSIKFSSLGYVGIAALCLIYTRYFSKTLHKMPFLETYELLAGIYIYVAVPAIYFSAAAFLSIIVYTVIPGAIPKVCRKFLWGAALVIFLVYAVLVLLGEQNPDSSFPIFFVAMMYPIVFAVPGIMFALGLHKK